MKKTRSLCLGAGSALALATAVFLLAVPAQAVERVSGASSGTGAGMLPQTGGPAMTWIFIAAGVLILLGAVVLVLRLMQKRNAEAGAAGSDAGAGGAAGDAGVAGLFGATDDTGHHAGGSGAGSGGDGGGSADGGGA